MSRQTDGRAPNRIEAEAGKPVGLVEWLRPGEQERVERLLRDLALLRIDRLRTAVSWADCHTREGRKWYKWLLPRLAKEVELLPCLAFTPPALGRAPSTASPPRDPRDYGAFVADIIEEHGDHFQWVELWNEPNNLSDWDWRLDPGWSIFAEMVGSAAHRARRLGKRTLLAGMAPWDPNWLAQMCERGVLDHIDAVGLHGFPGTWEFDGLPWATKLMAVRTVLGRHGCHPEVWITETGFSTWSHDDRSHLQAFMDALEAPADRVYWYGAHDLDPDHPTKDGLHSDERRYHMGLRKADGTPKLLHRLLGQGGLAAVADMLKSLERRPVRRKGAPVTLITGGAGFIGTNLADRLLCEGEPVLVLDNLSRPGTEQNLRWLMGRHPKGLEFRLADIRNRHALREAVARAGRVYHFAAQVAVTTSLANPVDDYEVNSRGTLNLLEEIRRRDAPPSLVFTSTNKVYGGLENVPLRETPLTYEPADSTTRAQGISELRGLEFRSPYGCSKGTSDQYVLDYAHTFEVPTAVFRMSCIYGPRQFGTEDQGWVAHFLKQALLGRPITIYGDGRQVRDVLFVDDLVEALLMAQARMSQLAGQAFNIGGGPANTLSLRQLLAMIEKLQGAAPEVQFQQWRTSDQRYYVSDTRRFSDLTGWRPAVDTENGVARLYAWLARQYGTESDDATGRMAL